MNTTVFNFADSYFDGSFVDVGSLVLALVFVVWQRRNLPCEDRCDFWSRQTGRALVNAISIFPLLLLSLSIFSSKLTELLLSGSKITLTIAGCYALFTMLEDLGGKNASLAKISEPEQMGPPAPPKLAPEMRMQPSHQTGKVLALPNNQGLSKSRRRRQSNADRKRDGSQLPKGGSSQSSTKS